MNGVNKVILLGTLGADPESRQFDNGGGVTNISIATTDKWKDKQNGEQKEETEWHRIDMFGRLGEIAAQYLRKGSKVYIEGQIKTRKYQAADGSDRYATSIKAFSMQMLDSKGDNQQQGGQQNNSYQKPVQNNQQGYQQPNQQQAPNQQQNNGQQGYQNNGNPQPQQGIQPPSDDVPF